MAKNTLFERFLKSLAERLNKENDISDVTYSLLKASDNFKKIFFEYIFETAVTH